MWIPEWRERRPLYTVLAPQNPDGATCGDGPVIVGPQVNARNDIESIAGCNKNNRLKSRDKMHQGLEVIKGGLVMSGFVPRNERPHVLSVVQLLAVLPMCQFLSDGVRIRESGAQVQRSARLGARLRRDEATGQSHVGGLISPDLRTIYFDRQCLFSPMTRLFSRFG